MSLRQMFYIQPMNYVYFEAAAMYVIWFLLMLFLPPKARRITACTGVVLSLVLIFALTLIGRKSAAVPELVLIPSVFVHDFSIPNDEVPRTMFMNFLLFLPLGMSLPFALPKRIKHKALVTIVTGIVLSLTAEVIQYFFHFGRCETDDLIMNTLGAVIGTTVFLLVGHIKSKTKQNNRK